MRNCSPIGVVTGYNCGTQQHTNKGAARALGRCEAPPCKVSPGFANSRVRALPHVHLRSLGSRPSSLRGLNEEFYKKKFKTKKLPWYGAWKIEKVDLHIESLVLFASAPTGFAFVCPPRVLTRIAHRRLDLRRSPMSSDERGGGGGGVIFNQKLNAFFLTFGVT